MDTYSQDPVKIRPIKPTVKRRQYSKSLKRQIVEECLAGNDSAAVVAHRHDINANLLFKWRRQYGTGDLGNVAEPPVLVPIVVDQPGQSRPSTPVSHDSGTRSKTDNLEVCLANGHRLLIVGAVCPVALRTALEVLST